MKKNIAMLIFYAIAGLILLPVLAYIVLEILNNEISLKTLFSNLSGAYFLGLLMNHKVYVSYFKINPVNVACWGLIGYGLFMLLLSNIGPTEKKRFEQREKYGSHGSSRWQREREIKENYYQGPREGWFLGSIEKTHFSLKENVAAHAVENSSNLNMQVNVAGPPGSNKTTGFVYPNMFYIPYSYRNSKDKPDIIVTDPKGEILAYTGNYFLNNNYEIKIIDFLHLKYGDATNPLSYIESEEDIMKIATGFVGAAAMKDAKSQNADPIWEQGESLLLAALISFVVEVFPPSEQTFETVGQVLASPNIRDFELAETLFARHNITGYGLELWNKFLNLEDKLRSGVVGGLSIKMALFSLSKVKKITGKNSFDFREIGRKKEKPFAIFIQMPDEDRTYSPIINTIISMMIKTMYSTARETFSKLPNPVYMILEEIANIGRLPGIEDLLGTMRGRRIYPMMIWQDLVQMKKMFGDSWEGIVAKCDTQVYLGVNDQFTSKYISEKLGKTTIKTQGTSEKGGGIMAGSGKTQSQNYSQRPLLFPDEVERFDNDKFFIVQRSRQPLSLHKTQYKFWETDKKIVEPLNLEDLPLVDRLYKKTSEEEIANTIEVVPENKELELTPIIPEMITPISKTESEITKEPEISIEEELSHVGYQEEIEDESIQFESINDYEDIEEEDFDFDEPEIPEDDFVKLPVSEFER
ncbi:MAG: type IV secretory system conjugative DNA transfer family protein [Bacillota bacterium]|nr:type IV secretory system conjugative DNA transfer family protein [Bacillota bacterium]